MYRFINDMLEESEEQEESTLFRPLDPLERTPEQVVYWQNGGFSTAYSLLRDPIHLNEIIYYQRGIAIWRDNHTLISLVVEEFPKDNRRTLCLTFHDAGLTFQIVGRTDDAVAETAAYFLNLEEPKDQKSSLVIRSNHFVFDFRAAQPQCLRRLFEVNPSRNVLFHSIEFSAEQ